MCVRFFIDKESKKLNKLIESAAMNPLADRFRNSLTVPILAAGEIGPESVTPVIATNRRGAAAVFPMQWGFDLAAGSAETGGPKRSTKLFNARAETAGEKATFAEAWRSHRCIVPASWYFEWTHPIDENGKKRTGERFSIRAKGEELTCLCGVYRIEAGLPKFVILTRPPVGELTSIHDRMPLILPQAKSREWIDPKNDPDRIADEALTEMLLWN